MHQKIITLPSAARGFHLITEDINAALKDMPALTTGMLNLFIQHTSASLCISENTCQDVREDLETYFNRHVPEDPVLYRHTLEGSDDMPAHIKNVLLGASLNIPMIDGQLALGQWQGICLCEHRDQAPSRRIVVTVFGI